MRRVKPSRWPAQQKLERACSILKHNPHKHPSQSCRSRDRRTVLKSIGAVHPHSRHSILSYPSIDTCRVSSQSPPPCAGLQRYRNPFHFYSASFGECRIRSKQMSETIAPAGAPDIHMSSWQFFGSVQSPPRIESRRLRLKQRLIADSLQRFLSQWDQRLSTDRLPRVVSIR